MGCRGHRELHGYVVAGRQFPQSTQGVTHIAVVVGEETGQGCGRGGDWGGGQAGGVTAIGHSVGGGAPQGLGGVHIAGGELGGEGCGGAVVLDDLGDAGDLQLLVVEAHEGGRVTDVAGGLFVLLDQDLQDAQIPPDALMVRLGKQVADAWHLGLAVAVHTAVALLEHHQ